MPYRRVIVVIVAGCILASAGLVRSGSAAPASFCSGRAVRAAVGDFAAAYNAGMYARLEARFAREPEFRWYSVNGPGVRTGADAYDRDSLLAYFRDRHRHRDRLRLVSMKFNGNSNGFGNFEIRFERRAADYRSGRPFRLVGKGAALCADAPAVMAAQVRFAAMSLGGPANA
jgi:hypothetical protein